MQRITGDSPALRHHRGSCYSGWCYGWWSLSVCRLSSQSAWALRLDRLLQWLYCWHLADWASLHTGALHTSTFTQTQWV